MWWQHSCWLAALAQLLIQALSWVIQHLEGGFAADCPVWADRAQRQQQKCSNCHPLLGDPGWELGASGLTYKPRKLLPEAI